MCTTVEKVVWELKVKTSVLSETKDRRIEDYEYMIQSLSNLSKAEAQEGLSPIPGDDHCISALHFYNICQTSTQAPQIPKGL